MSYTATKQLAVGTGEDDPDRPGATLVRVYEPGDEVDVSGIDNVQALVDNGYLTGTGDDAVKVVEATEDTGGEEE